MLTGSACLVENCGDGFLYATAVWAPHYARGVAGGVVDRVGVFLCHDCNA